MFWEPGAPNCSCMDLVLDDVPRPVKGVFSHGICVLICSDCIRLSPLEVAFLGRTAMLGTGGSMEIDDFTGITCIWHTEIARLACSSWILQLSSGLNLNLL